MFSSFIGGGAPLQIHSQTTVALNQDNFVLVKTNKLGRSKGSSLLGFITIVPPSLSTAIDRMYASADMSCGEPQTVTNLIFQQSMSYWILFGIPKVEVHADVIEFRPEAATKPAAKPGPDDPPTLPARGRFKLD